MKYYDVQRNWRKVKLYLEDPVVATTLVEDFNKYTFGRWDERFMAGEVPRKYETFMGLFGHRGRTPRYWDYVKHGACHWLVNFNLELAQRTVPRHEWRIVTSDEHSTCWDGQEMLFDMNFQALGVAADDAYRVARTKGVELSPGKHLKVYFAEDYRHDMAKALRLGKSLGMSMIRLVNDSDE